MSSIVNEFRIFDNFRQNLKQDIKSFFVPESDRAICVTNEDKVYALGKFMKLCGYSSVPDEINYVEVEELCDQNIEEFYYFDNFIFAKNKSRNIFGWRCNWYYSNNNMVIQRKIDDFKIKHRIKHAKIEFLDNENILDISCGYNQGLLLTEKGVVFGIAEQDENTEFSELTGLIPFKIDSVYGITELTRSINCYKNSSLLLSVNYNVYFSCKSDLEFILKVSLVNVCRIFISDNNKLNVLKNDRVMCYANIEQISPENQPSLHFEYLFPSHQGLVDSTTFYSTFSMKILVESERGIYHINLRQFEVNFIDKYNQLFDYFLNERQSTHKTIHIKDNGIYVKNYEFKENPNSPQNLFQESMKTIYQNNEEFNKNYSSDLTLKKFRIINPFPDNLELNVKYYHQIGEYNKPEYSVIFVMNDNKVYGIGCNQNGCLGLGHNTRVTKYTPIPKLCDQIIEEFFTGTDCMFARTDKNEIFGWGKNGFGQLGRGYKSNWSTYKLPKKIKQLENKGIIKICGGNFHYLGLSIDGCVYGWGGIDRPNKKFTIPTRLKFDCDENVKIKYIHCNCLSSCAISFDGRAYLWSEANQDPLIRKIRGLSNFPVEISPKKFEENVTKIILCEISSNTTRAILEESGSFKVISCINNEKIFEKNEVSEIMGLHDENSDWVLLLKNSRVYEYDILRNKITKTTYSNFYDYIIYKRKRIDETIHISSDGYLMRHQIEVNQNYSENSDQPRDLLDNNLVNIYENYFENSFEMENNGKPIGEGSGGEVYKASNKVNKISFAVKKIKIDKNRPKEKDIWTVMREIQTMKQINSKYVVNYNKSWTEKEQEKIEGEDQEHNILYIQMELCLQSLRKFLKTINQLSDDKFKTIQYFLRTELFVELIECLKELPQIGIIHRDLRPENVLVTDGTDGRFVKLCDFGLSKLLDNSINSKTGDDDYMARETRIRNPPQFSHLSDIYSLGVIGLDDLFKGEFAEYSNTCLEEKSIKLIDMFERMVSYDEKADHQTQRAVNGCQGLLDEINECRVDHDPIMFEKISSNYRELFESNNKEYEIFLHMIKVKLNAWKLEINNISYKID